MAPPLVKKAAAPSRIVATEMLDRIKESLAKIRNSFGTEEAERLVHAADEGANLGLYTPRALERAVGGNGHLLTVMDPGRFQDFAARIPDQHFAADPYNLAMDYRFKPGRNKFEHVMEEYGDIGRESGWSEVPELRFSMGTKQPVLNDPNIGAILPTKRDYPYVQSHEGRHRSMAIDRYLQEPKSLVVIRPHVQSDLLMMPTPNDTHAERLAYFKQFLESKGRRVVPEEQSYSPLLGRGLTEKTLPKLDELFAEGGPVHMREGGGMLRRLATRFEKGISDWYGDSSRKAAEQAMWESRSNGMEAGRFGTEDWLSPRLLGQPSSVMMGELYAPEAGAGYGKQQRPPNSSGYNTFRVEVDEGSKPGFQIHTHPPLTLDGQRMASNGDRLTEWNNGGVGPITPSRGDLRNWLIGYGHYPERAPNLTSYIHGGQDDQIMAMGTPDYAKSRGAMSMQDMVKKALNTESRFNADAWKVANDPDVRAISYAYGMKNPTQLWGLLGNEALARQGVPITMEQNARYGNGLAEDALNDVVHKLFQRGNFAEGGAIRMAGAGSVADKITKVGGALRRLSGKARDEVVQEAVEANKRLKPDEFLPANPRVQTVDDPQRLAYPGIYRNPKEIAQQALDAVIPEGEAMKTLFGVSRGDLDAISQGRNYGALSAPDHAFPFPARGRGAAVSEGVLTPANMRRIVDISGESLKHDPLKFTRSWYEMQPFWDRAAELGLSPEEMQRMNARIGLHSALADPRSEVNRGTLANKLINEGRLDDYVNFGGYGTKGSIMRNGEYRPSRFEVEGFPADMLDMKSHLAHKAHVGKLLELEKQGFYPPSSPKVATYIQATDPLYPDPRRPIADSHFARGIGYGDVRQTASPGVELSGPEYRDLLPWWEKASDKLDLHPRDHQAMLWNVMGPQTGVKYIGPPKLEILSDEIMKASRRLGVAPDMARDMVITGKAGAYAHGGSVDDSPPFFDYQTPEIGSEGMGALSSNADALGSTDMLGIGHGPSQAMLAQTNAVDADADRLMASVPKMQPMRPQQQGGGGGGGDAMKGIGQIANLAMQFLPMLLEEGGSVPGYAEGGAGPAYDPMTQDNYDALMMGGDDYGDGRFTRTPAERRVVRERALAGQQPYFDDLNQNAGDFWSNELENLRKVGYHPAKYGMGALHRLGSAISPEGPSAEDIANFVSPDMGMRHEYGPVAAPLDVLLILANTMTAGGMLGRIGKQTLSKFTPTMRRMVWPTAAPVYGEAAREMSGYADGGEVEDGYQYSHEADWDGVPGASMYAQGGVVDDDALLYHAIDTQNFSRGGALRACGGYAR